MSEQLKEPAGDNGTHAANIDEFYVRRINWLIMIGRCDLIDEIADDCERRRSAPTAGAPDNMSATDLPPRPIEEGTRLAVARLRRSSRPPYRHVPDSQSIRG
jgi:hypothetical protein